MKVYTLEACYDYEPSTLVGVFRTRKQAEKAQDESYRSPSEWRITDWKLPYFKKKRQPLPQPESQT